MPAHELATAILLIVVPVAFNGDRPEHVAWSGAWSSSAWHSFSA